MMPIQALLFGAIVGLSLGLTGGGGAIFAVPLLVYGLSVDPRQAVGISLAAVGMTSLVGFCARWKFGQVDIATGLVFAVAGMAGAPLGSWLSNYIPERLLLTLFALLMLVVAVRMWRMAGLLSLQFHITTTSTTETEIVEPRPRHHHAARNMLPDARHTALLCAVGLMTGILAGLFGVGGGFVIVPALVLLGRMAIHRAIGTSLLVITLISASGLVSHLLTGREIPLDTTAYFVVGGVLGMSVGLWVTRFLSGPTLQRLFAAAIVAVAALILVRLTFYS